MIYILIYIQYTPDDGLHTGPKHVVAQYILLLIIYIVVFYDCMYV